MREYQRGQYTKKIPSLRQFFYLHHLCTTKEKLILKCSLYSIVIGLTLLVGQLIWNHWGIAPKKGGEISIGVVGSASYINPLFAPTHDSDQLISNLVFSGLTTFNTDKPQDPYTADLATTIEHNKEFTQYTATLRPNLYWHDGAAITTADVAFTIERALDPVVRSPLAASLRGVIVQVLDDKKIRFTLPQPSILFPEVLAFGIIPKHLWLEIPPESMYLATLNTQPVGSGPYMFDRVQKNSSGIITSLRLTRSKHPNNTQPYLDKLTLRFFTNQTELNDYFSKQRLDIIGFLPKNNLPATGSLKQYSLLPLEFQQYSAIFFRLSNPLLAQEPIRKALQLALDIPTIISNIYPNTAKPIGGPFLNSHPPKPVDLLAAKSILDKEGWKIVNGVRQKGGKKLTLTITVVDTQDQRDLATTIQKAWSDIGVLVQINTINQQSAQSTIRQRKFDSLIYGQIVGSYDDIFAFWHSSQSNDPGVNLSGFIDKNTDDILETMRKTNDPTERQKLKDKLQTIFDNQVPAIFLYRPQWVMIANNNVHGIDPLSLSTPTDCFIKINQWYTKTRWIWK